MKAYCKLLATLFCLTTSILTAQIDTLDDKDLIYCRVSANNVYVVRNKKATLREYNVAFAHNDSLRKLRNNSTFEKPVWVRSRYKNGNIESEGLKCGECVEAIGTMIYYYEDGGVRAIQSYMVDMKEAKTSKKQKGFNWCSYKQGEQIEYDEKGGVKLKQYYEKGRIIRCERYKYGKLYTTTCG